MLGKRKGCRKDYRVRLFIYEFSLINCALCSKEEHSKVGHCEVVQFFILHIELIRTFVITYLFLLDLILLYFYLRR